MLHQITGLLFIYANYMYYMYLLHRHAHRQVITMVHADLHFAVNMWICVVLSSPWLISLLYRCFIYIFCEVKHKSIIISSSKKYAFINTYGFQISISGGVSHLFFKNVFYSSALRPTHINSVSLHISKIFRPKYFALKWALHFSTLI